MRLVRFERAGSTGFGIVEGGEVIDLTGADGIGCLSDLLNDCPALRSAAAKAPRLPLEGLTLLPPLATGVRNLWVGANYRTLKSNRDGSSPGGAFPSLFMRSPQSLAGHRGPIVRPRVSEQLDYEGEVVIIIGKGGRHIPEAEALAHIGGLTIANDGCLRDFMDHGRNVTAGKVFDSSGAMGPWIVTRDELDPGETLALETRVNGELRQRDTTDSMRFSFAHLIAYISSFMELLPGDAIATGSPQGAAGGPFGFDPPRWLKAGDTIEITVSGIGTLCNTVVDE